MQDFFLRYLTAKKTVDDRALNAHVWQKMAAVLRERPLTVLEIGAGIGTMIERLAAANLLHQATYTAMDNDPNHIAIAQKRLQAVSNIGSLNFTAIDLFDFIADEKNRGAWDMIIAHAFLDLLDIPTALPKIFSLLRPGGYFYFTINFDAGTIFEPTIDPMFDASVERIYHQSMDERVTNGRLSGDSKSGRHLFTTIREAGGRVTAAGSSDWVVFAHKDGYLAEEAFFLHTIIGYVEKSLKGRSDIDQIKLQEWLAIRRDQIDRGELVYIAHQIDLFGYREALK